MKSIIIVIVLSFASMSAMASWKGTMDWRKKDEITGEPADTWGQENEMYTVTVTIAIQSGTDIDEKDLIDVYFPSLGESYKAKVLGRYKDCYDTMNFRVSWNPYRSHNPFSSDKEALLNSISTLKMERLKPQSMSDKVSCALGL